MDTDTPRHQVFSSLVPLGCFFVIVGAVAYSLVAPPLLAPELDAYASARAVVEGVVIDDPEIREEGTRLILEVDTVNGQPTHRRSRILIAAGKQAGFEYGDRIRVNGIIKFPESFETESGRTFDYPHYLRAKGISYQISFGRIVILSRGYGNPLFRTLYSVKHTLLSGINRSLPEPESALAAGILLGEKQSLGEELTEKFRRAGLVHIIVLSGYNVSVVIVAVLFVALRLVPRAIALGIAALGIVLFALMTGASETTIRASAMAGIVILAQGLHRRADALRILLIVAAGMAVWNPFLVLYDLSYQLSILATLGLILFSGPLEKRLGFVPETLGFRQILAATLATQITVLPLLILSFGQMSVVSLIANPVVLPAVEFAMLFSFLASTVALFSVTLALPLSFVAYLALHYIVAAGSWFGSLSLASFSIPPAWDGFALGALALLYVGAFRYGLGLTLASERRSLP